MPRPAQAVGTTEATLNGSAFENEPPAFIRDAIHGGGLMMALRVIRLPNNGWQGRFDDPINVNGRILKRPRASFKSCLEQASVSLQEAGSAWHRPAGRQR